MSAGEKVFAAILVIFGSATLLCVLAGWLAARRDRSVDEREAIQDPPPRAVGRAAVVASDDLDPLERLWLAPAYGEEHAS